MSDNDQPRRISSLLIPDCEYEQVIEIEIDS